MRAWTSPDVPRLDLGDGARRCGSTTPPPARCARADPDGAARMYVCGITPYDATHLGHAATYLAFDLLNRAWRDAGHDVHYVQNVTDVDDPLLERADRDRRWTGASSPSARPSCSATDMTALRVLPPDALRRRRRVDPADRRAGRAAAASAARVYDVDGDLYFSVRSDPRFGSVSRPRPTTRCSRSSPSAAATPTGPARRTRSTACSGRRERPGEPAWDSRARPRPARLARRVLGDRAATTSATSFDVQGGGSDLVFPHHEMSASEAQVADRRARRSRRPTCTPGWSASTARRCRSPRATWSSSPRLREAGVDPMAIRLALLAHHYRTDWEWTDADLAAAEERLARWRAAVAARPRGAGRARSCDGVRAALADDLDAPARAAPSSTAGPTRRQRGRRLRRAGAGRATAARRPASASPL